MQTPKEFVGCCLHPDCSYVSDPKPTKDKAEEAVLRHHVRMHKKGRAVESNIIKVPKDIEQKAKASPKIKLTADITVGKKGVSKNGKRIGRPPGLTKPREVVFQKTGPDKARVLLYPIPAEVQEQLDALDPAVAGSRFVVLVTHGLCPICAVPVLQLKDEMEEIALRKASEHMLERLKLTNGHHHG
jgi:hypothetical protein